MFDHTVSRGVLPKPPAHRPPQSVETCSGRSTFSLSLSDDGRSSRARLQQRLSRSARTSRIPSGRTTELCNVGSLERTAPLDMQGGALQPLKPFRPSCERLRTGTRGRASGCEPVAVTRRRTSSFKPDPNPLHFCFQPATSFASASTDGLPVRVPLTSFEPVRAPRALIPLRSSLAWSQDRFSTWACRETPHSN